MARGDFSATDLGRIVARLNTIYNGPKLSEQLNAPYDVLREMLARQTASFRQITVGSECRGVKATYLKDCDDTMLDCTADILTECKIVGKRVESVSTNFDINDCIYDGITVYDDECDNNSVKADEKVAFGLAKFFSKLRTNLETKAMAFLIANATDFNGVTIDYGTVNGIDTTNIDFAAADWTGSIIGKLLWLADQHGAYDPFIADSGNLWLPQWENQFKSGGCCTVDSLQNGPIDLTFGTKSIKTATGKASTFLIDPNSYAFWSRNYYQSLTPVPMQDEFNSFVWKMPVPGLTFGDGAGQQALYVDVIRQRQCEIASGNHRWKTVWLLKAHFVFNAAPNICADGETGIIHTVNVG